MAKLPRGLKRRLALKYGKSPTWVKKVEDGEFSADHPIVNEIRIIKKATAEVDEEIDKFNVALKRLQKKRQLILEKLVKQLDL